jgi:hypothetical protein
MAVACLLLLATASQAAIFTYQWAGGGTTATVREGERATLEVYIELQPDAPPIPGPNDELGFLLYVLTAFNFDGLDPAPIGCNGYGNPLEPGYFYTNICGVQPAGFTGSEIRWAIESEIKTWENTGPTPFLVSTVGVEGLPCDEIQLPNGTDTLLFVADPGTDLAMFRRDLVTAVPLTNGTPNGITLHNTCTPEPTALALLAVGGLAALRRRR